MRSPAVRQVLIGLSLFVGICVFAVIGYVREGWSVDDAVYMVIITIFGVGYGEVKPIDSPSLRALTIAVIVVGYAAAIYVVGGLVQFLIDGEIQNLLRSRKMSQGIASLRGHTIICGFGRMGEGVAKELQQKKSPFVIVDSSEAKIEAAQDAGYLAMLGNVSEEETLMEAGIEHAQSLAILLPDDATNVFACLTARDLNKDIHVISRGQSESGEKKLLRCGANHVVLATSIGAKRTAQLIMRPSAASLLKESGVSEGINDELALIGLHMEELKVDSNSEMIGNSLEDIEVRGNRGFLIVAVRSAAGAVNVNPDCETRLSQGDVVIVVGYRNDIADLCVKHSMQRRETQPREMTYRGVTVKVQS